MVEAPTKQCAVCGVVFAKPPTDSRRTWEKRRCCSYRCSVEIRRGRPNPKLGDAHRGKQLSPEHRAKISKTYQQTQAAGKVRHARANLGLRGAETSQWKGDDITYRSAHCRLTRNRGKPTKCELCGTTEGRLEWALKHDPEVVKVETPIGKKRTLFYSPRPDDYFAACCSCHQAYDGSHPRDPSTGRYLPKGGRVDRGSQFDHVLYDADADVAYLSIGEPRRAVGEQTPEGHVLLYDEETGEFCGLTLIGEAS